MYEKIFFIVICSVLFISCRSTGVYNNIESVIETGNDIAKLQDNQAELTETSGKLTETTTLLTETSGKLTQSIETITESVKNATRDNHEIELSIKDGATADLELERLLHEIYQQPISRNELPP